MGAKNLLLKILNTSGLQLFHKENLDQLDDSTAQKILKVITTPALSVATATYQPSYDELIQSGAKKIAAGDRPIF